jgi:RNA polymerase sigma-70 factor (ECF subfamily)
VTDYYRKRASAAKALGKLAEDAVEDEDSSDVTGEAGIQFSRCLEPLMRELPEQYREALTLTELKGLTQNEAAQKLGLSIPGMKSRVQRGRGKLKDIILDCCSVEFDRRGGLVEYNRRAKGGCDECNCE